MENGVILTGIDGSDPLHFLCTLGILNILNKKFFTKGEGCLPKVAWKNLGKWRPIFLGIETFDELINSVLDDRESFNDDILNFEYVKLEKNGSKLFKGLRPPLAVLRGWIHRSLSNDNDAEYTACLMAETASEKLKDEKVVDYEVILEKGIVLDIQAPLDKAAMPTFFDFTSRNAQFLDQLKRIKDSFDVEEIAKELLFGLFFEDEVRTMGWDITADAPNALFGDRQKCSKPVVEWLAFRGLPFFPVFGYGSGLNTTSCRGKRKNGVFLWPIWEIPVFLSRDVVFSLMSYKNIEFLAELERKRLGIECIFMSKMEKAADGYSGIFAPSSFL